MWMEILLLLLVYFYFHLLNDSWHDFREDSDSFRHSLSSFHHFLLWISFCPHALLLEPVESENIKYDDWHRTVTNICLILTVFAFDETSPCDPLWFSSPSWCSNKLNRSGISSLSVSWGVEFEDFGSVSGWSWWSSSPSVGWYPVPTELKTCDALRIASDAEKFMLINQMSGRILHFSFFPFFEWSTDRRMYVTFTSLIQRVLLFFFARKWWRWFFRGWDEEWCKMCFPSLHKKKICLMIERRNFWCQKRRVRIVQLFCSLFTFPVLIMVRCQLSSGLTFTLKLRSVQDHLFSRVDDERLCFACEATLG